MLPGYGKNKNIQFVNKLLTNYIRLIIKLVESFAVLKVRNGKEPKLVYKFSEKWRDLQILQIIMETCAITDSFFVSLQRLRINF